jgi:hypothetical protein
MIFRVEAMPDRFLIVAAVLIAFTVAALVITALL